MNFKAKSAKPFFFKLLFIMVLPLFLITGGCGSRGEAEDASAGKEEKAEPVEAVQVVKGTVSRTAVLNGTAHASTEVKIVPKTGGIVAHVAVDVGSRVNKGDVLVRLETDQLEAQVRQAEAAHAAAGAGAEAARQGAITAAKSLEAVRAEYEELAAGTRPEKIEQAASQVASAEALYTNARKDWERMKYLFEEGAVSEQQYDSATAHLKQAEAQLKNAREALKIAESGPTEQQLKAAQARLEQAESSYKQSQANAKQVEKQVAQARASLELAREQLEDAVIRSPINGTVSFRYIDPGEMASPGNPVLVVSSLDPLIVKAKVPERYVNSLSKGQEVKVELKNAAGRAFTGKIKSIGPVMNPQSKAYDLEISLPNPELLVKPGMTAVVEAEVETVKEALVVPAEAVLDRDGEKVVFVVAKDSRVQMRKIEVRTSNDREAAVSGDLLEGELVVVLGQHSLEDGAPVSVVTGRSAE